MALNHLVLNTGQQLFGYSGVEFKFPVWFWNHWPKITNENGLLFLRNSQLHSHSNVSWHSTRDYPRFLSLRMRVLNAICDNDIQALGKCLDEGWPINEVIDHD